MSYHLESSFDRTRSRNGNGHQVRTIKARRTLLQTPYVRRINLPLPISRWEKNKPIFAFLSERLLFIRYNIISVFYFISSGRLSSHYFRVIRSVRIGTFPKSEFNIYGRFNCKFTVPLITED